MAIAAWHEPVLLDQIAQFFQQLLPQLASPVHEPVLLDQIAELFQRLLPQLASPSVLNLNIFLHAQQFAIDQSGIHLNWRTLAPRILENTGTPNALRLELSLMAQKPSLRTIRTTALKGSEEEESSFQLGDKHFNTQGRIFNVWDPGNSVLCRFTFIIAISRADSAACLRLLPKKEIDGTSEQNFGETYVEVGERRKQGQNSTFAGIRLKDGMDLEDNVYIDVQRSFDIDFKSDRVQTCGNLSGEALGKLIKAHLNRYSWH